MNMRINNPNSGIPTEYQIDQENAEALSVPGFTNNKDSVASSGSQARTGATLPRDVLASTPQLNVPEYVDPVQLQQAITNFLQQGGAATGAILGGTAGVGVSAGVGNVASPNTAETTSTNGTGTTNTLSQEAIQQNLTTTFHDQLQNFVEGNNLSADDLKKLQFAFYNAGAVGADEKLSDGTSVKDALSGLMTTTLQTLQAKGIDVTGLVPDNKAFNLEISDTYNINLQNALQNAVGPDGKPLSDADKAALKFVHYNPSSKTTLSPELQKILENLQASALKQTQGEFQTPANFQPALNSDIYNGVLKSNFGIALQLNLNQAVEDNQLSSADAKTLAALLQDPSTPASAELKALATQVLNKTITDNQVQSNLPVAWKPDVTTMSSILTDQASDLTAQTFIQAHETLNKAIKAVQLFLPEGPEKTQTLNLLFTISAALLNLQSIVREVQIAQTEASKKDTTAKMGLQQQQNDELKTQNEKIAKQIKKQAKLGILMKIFKPLMKIIEVIMAALTGGILAGVFAALDAKFDLTSKAMRGIQEGLAKLIDLMIPNKGNNPDLERFKHGLKAALTAFVMIQILTSPIVMSYGLMNVVNLATKVISESSIFIDIGQMFGMSKENAQWLAFAVGLAVTIAIAIASSINPGKAAASVATTTATVATRVASTLQKVAGPLSNVLKAIETSAALTKGVAAMGRALEKVGDVLNGAVSKIIQKVIDKVEDFVNLMEKVSRPLRTALKEVLQSARQFKTFDKVFKSIKDFADGILDPSGTGALKILNAIELGQAAIGAATTFVQAGSEFSQAKVAKIKAEADAVIAELQAMVKMLQKMIDSLLKGVSDMGDDINSIKATLDSVFASNSQVLQKTTSIQP